MVGLSSVLNKKNLSLQPNRPFVSWIDVDKDMYINMLVLLHRALLKLSKWFGGLWLTRIVNRASEFLTGLWQDSVVHYSRGICQKLYGADYSRKGVRKVWNGLRFEVVSLFIFWRQYKVIKFRSTSYLCQLYGHSGQFGWTLSQQINLWCFCNSNILTS